MPDGQAGSTLYEVFLKIYMPRQLILQVWDVAEGLIFVFIARVGNHYTVKENCKKYFGV